MIQLRMPRAASTLTAMLSASIGWMMSRVLPINPNFGGELSRVES
jgi:hypothetical protein